MILEFEQIHTTQATSIVEHKILLNLKWLNKKWGIHINQRLIWLCLLNKCHFQNSYIIICTFIMGSDKHINPVNQDGINKQKGCSNHGPISVYDEG